MRHRALIIATLTALAALSSWAGAALKTATLDFHPDDIALRSESSYIGVSIEGCVSLSEVGTPDLPVRLLSFVIPADARVEDVLFECGDVEVLPGTYRVLPSQPQVPTGQVAEWVDGDPGIYSSPGLYPASRAEYMGDGFLGGYRIATVAIHPIQYEPTTGKLLLARDASVELVLGGAADRSRPRERVTARSAETYRRLVAGLVENPEDVALARAVAPLDETSEFGFQPKYSPSLEGSPVEYVVITTDALEPLFSEFAEWKTRLGVPTVVRTISWIEANYTGGVDAPERIRDFILDAYESWGTTYVLLGGDTDVVPTRYARSDYGGGALIPCDLYYSSLEGDWNGDGDEFFGEGYRGLSSPGDSVDLYPDVFVGRAPVDNVLELETFISKCHAYVENPDIDFTNRALFLAEVLFPYDWESGPFSFDGASDIIEPMLGTFPPGVHLAKLYANRDPYPESYPLNAPASMDSLIEGYNIAVHVGHGSKDILRVGKNNYLSMADISSLTNGPSKSSFFWLLDCSTVAMDYDCIAERAMNNPTGGAIGAFGATRYEFPATSREYLWEWADLLYTHDVVRMGETSGLAKAAFASPAISGDDAVHRWTQLSMMLMGDPELPLWTDRARDMSVSHDPSVLVGESVLSVTVTDDGPVAGALVTVSKSGDVYERALTGPDGVANIIVRPDFEGTISVAATALNHMPAESSVQVLPASGPHLFVDTFDVDDNGLGTSSGNDNGAIEAGEEIELNVEVRNSGTSAAGLVSAVISTADPAVTITDGSQELGTIAAGSSTVIGSAFAFSVSDTCPAEHDVVFAVGFSDSAKQLWTDELTVRVFRPELRLFLLDVDDSAGNGNGVADPGESVTLEVEIANDGTGEADDVSGTLTAPCGGATVVDGSESWGSIAGGQSRVGSLGIDLVVGPDPGEALSLDITDRYGRVWHNELDLSRPSVPDSLWGNVMSTTIELAWTQVADADVRGYMVHRSLGPDGPFTQANSGIIESGSLYSDAGLAENTLYYYYVTAVDSSGNRSDQSEKLAISTNPPSQSGWPLTTNGGMYASPAIADLDGDGQPEVVVASEHIYAWHQNGIEVLDGDGDARTQGIFEDDGTGGYRGSPAVGEIDGDSGVEIVAAAWADVSEDHEAGLFEVYAWNAEDGSVLPGWPVTTKKFCWASPTLADLDRDGLFEIVIACADGYLYCWNHDGTELIDGDGNPSTIGPFAYLHGSWVYGSTAVADLDGDDTPELIQPSTSDSIYAFHADGSRVEGWPVNVVANAMCSPAVGDVDGDGSLEILVGSNASKFWLLSADGTVMPGWPKNVTTGGDFPPSPVLADVTGNGELEAVIAGKSGTLLVADYHGNVLPGWPIQLGYDTYSSPVVADLDDDPDLEIAIGCNSGEVFAFDADGALLAGWPIRTGAEVIGTPAVCDLDGDGDNEVVVGGMDTNVYIWDTAGAYDDGAGVEWGSFLYDAYRSQLYGFDEQTGVGDGSSEIVEFAKCVLEQNSPNPFNPVTTIGFTIPEGVNPDSRVMLSIYAVDGSLVRTLFDGPKESGHHSVVWDGRDRGGNRVASGVYFYRLTHEAGAESKSMVLMK